MRHGGRTLDDKELDSLTGYQIAHFGLCGIGAFMLALTGAELVDSLWTAISVVSTFGPSPTMGAFGDADELGRLGQLVMIPGMLAGRLTILPLLLAVAAVQQGYRACSSAFGVGEATTMSNGRFLPSGRRQSVGQPRCPSVRRRSKVRRCTSWASPSLRSRSGCLSVPSSNGVRRIATPQRC